MQQHCNIRRNFAHSRNINDVLAVLLLNGIYECFYSLLTVDDISISIWLLSFIRAKLTSYELFAAVCTTLLLVRGYVINIKHLW